MDGLETSIRRTYDRFDRPRGFDWFIRLDDARRTCYSSLAAGDAFPDAELAIASMLYFLDLLESCEQ